MATSDEKVLRLFVSSPGDVQGERERVDLVVELLNAEFKGRVQIKTTRWETGFYSSHDTFQGQIPEAAESDAVIAIFGARLGSQLPPSFPPMPTGDPYPSGTAYEVLSAIEARRKGQGVPDIYVFRRPNAPSVALDAANRAEIELQWSRLRQFFERWFLSKNGEFLAAFQEFSTTDEFAGKVEACLRQWLARRGFSAHQEVWDRILLGSPFPGLSAFDESRRSVFFGRELVIEQTIERLRRAGEPDAENRRAPFLLILGASGSGKSSLLRAGLLPRLVQPGAVPLVDHWRKALIVPGADPFLSLAEALFAPEALGTFLREGTFRTKEMLARQLAGEPEIAVAPLRDALDKAAEARQREARFGEPRPARLALAIDQAERLLLEIEPELAARFAELLAALVHRDVAYVVMALRSDSYARFQNVDALVSLREAGATIDLLAPTAGELEAMVTRPVAACEPPLAFEQRGGRSLAAELIADARGGDALPLLQIILARLYAAEAGRGDGLLRFADYRGMDEAVTQTANEALDRLEPAAQAELPALVTGLVRDVVADPVTGAVTPVVASLDRPSFEAQRPARKALVDAFVAERLLTTEGDEAGERVRPVHEALLRIWPQALAIVEEAGNLIRVRHALEPIVREWADSAADDKGRHLDISAALLGGAQRLLERFGNDLPPPMRAFIAQSSAVAEARAAHEREEQERRLRDAQAIASANRRTAQRTGVGLVAALVLAGLAAWQWRSADVAKVEAQSQRARAENALTLATNTADDLVFDIGQKSTCVLGMPKPVLKDILDRARGLQEQLLNAGEFTSKLKANHGVALGELARTQLALGDLKGALDLARQARDIFADVSAKAPDNSVFIFSLALSDLTIGDILQQQSDLDGALTAYQRAEASITAAQASGKNDARIQSAQASADEDIGSIQMTRADYAGALQSFRRAQTILASLEAAAPANVAARNRLAIVNREIGDALLKLKDIDGAAAAFNTASVISEPLARTNPDDTCLVRDYSLSAERLGETLTAKHDLAGALKAFEAGEDTALAMASKDPANMQWQYDIAIGYTEIGNAKNALGDLGGAVEAYRSGSAIDKNLVAHDAENAQWQAHYWADLSSLADALLRQKAFGAAAGTQREALAFLQSIVARHPADIAWQREVVLADNGLGDALSGQENYDDARKAFEDGLTVARRLADANPKAEDLQALLDISLGKMAGVLSAVHDVDGALKSYRESEFIARKLLLSEPDGARRRSELAVLLISIGHLLLTKNADDEAIAAFRESATLAQALAAENATDTFWQREQSIAAQGNGDALLHKGDVAGFVEAYRQSLAIDSALLQKNAADENLRATIALKQELIGAVLSGQKDFAGAAEAFRTAADTRRGLVEAGLDEAKNRRAQMIDDNRVGDSLAARQDYAGALDIYRDGLTMARSLDGGGEADVQSHFDLAISLNSVGWMQVQLKDYVAAEPAFAEALPIMAAMVKSQPANVAYQREYWLVSVNLGDSRLLQNNRAGALELYLPARDTAAALVAANAGDKTFPFLLKTSVDKIGYAANAMFIAGDYDAALKALDQAAPVSGDQNWFDLVRAGCLMFLGHADEARAIYLKHRGEMSLGGKPWEAVAIEGFSYMRARGMSNPLMDEITETFTVAPK